MKYSIVSIFVCIFIIASGLQAYGENNNREISIEKAMQYYCTIWTNPAYAKMDGKMLMKKDGTFEWFAMETSKHPNWFGTFEIKKGWIDKDNNIWIKMIYHERRFMKYTVAKISNEGNTLEQVWAYDNYPTRLTPNTNGYIIGYTK